MRTANLTGAALVAEIRHNLDGLGSPDAIEAELAALQLERIGPPAVPFLAELVRGDDPGLALMAADVLKRIDSPMARTVLKQWWPA